MLDSYKYRVSPPQNVRTFFLLNPTQRSPNFSFYHIPSSNVIEMMLNVAQITAVLAFCGLAVASPVEGGVTQNAAVNGQGGSTTGQINQGAAEDHSQVVQGMARPIFFLVIN